VAVAEVEAGGVLGTLDLEAPELAVGEVELLMRAHVVEGVELAVLGVREAELELADPHVLHRVDGELVGGRNAVPSQA
jgi:hypothetical protein